MLFNSIEFIYFFLPVTVFLFYAASHFRLIKLSKAVLTGASFFFYGYWNLLYLVLILFKIITNYFLAVLLEARRQKWVLRFGVIFNLGILCYFKYLDFFLGLLGPYAPTVPLAMGVGIPLGISFYTFTQIAYLEDLYERKTRFYGLGQYSLFVIFFPHLIAGPIVHYSKIMPQFDRIRTYLGQYRNFFEGIFFFCLGLFQKTVIADSISPIADAGFSNASVLSGIEAWGAVTAYTMQIYFDFAGYSNMAIGLGLLFNIRFPANFNSPYQAVSLVDFWRRWHITLSQFLRDYLYIRLGGNRFGDMRKYANVLITMLIGGLWHGAGWTFIVWGGYHGALLAANHFFDDRGIKVPPIIGRVLTLALVVYGWVFFRAPDMPAAMQMSRALAGLGGSGFFDTHFISKFHILALAGPATIALFARNAEFWALKIQPTFRWWLLFCGVFMADILFLNRESAFLYFQF